MPLYRLTSEEMLQLSATMVEPGHRDHVALMSQPDLAGLMPGLTSAHQALLVTSQICSTEPETERAAVLDDGYDDAEMRARAMWNRLINVLRSVVSTVQIDAPEVVAIVERITRAEQAASRRASMAEHAHGGASAAVRQAQRAS